MLVKPLSAYEGVRGLVNTGSWEKAAEELAKLQPHEVVEILERLNSEERRKILVYFPLKHIRDELGKLPPEIVADIVSVKGLDNLVEVVKELPVDEAVDFLSKMPSKTRLEVLRSLPGEQASVIAKLLKFPPESVGGIMTTMVPVFTDDATVGEALDMYIQKSRLGLYESSHYIYIISSATGELVGYTDLKTLLGKPRDLKLNKIAQPVKVHVHPFDDRETAAKIAIQYDLLEVPVVDFDGRFLGIVTLDDLLDVVVSEYSEDLMKYAGFAEAVKGSYATESALKLALKRAPVLVYLYLMDAITGSIVAAFESVIEKVTLLAAFMPMLADNSGNIGSQASALILRGLVTGEVKLNKRDLLMVLRKELISTAFMVLILFPVSFALGFAIPFFATSDVAYSLRLASVVSSALVVSCYVADIVGAFLPVALAKLGVDPATASAPVITSIADIATVTVYFIVASVLFKL